MYKTPNNFKLACFYDTKDKNPSWKLIMQIKDYTYRSLVEIDTDDISVHVQAGNALGYRQGTPNGVQRNSETKQDSGINRHAADTRIGLICNTVTEEAVGR